MASEHPKVFISYSHDSPERAQHVLELAERLRKDGVDAQLDQYVAGTPPEGWPRWMQNQLDWAEFVLVVCTETYYRRFRGHEEPGKGKGADWEGNLVTTEMYNAKSRTTKFAPVFFDRPDEQFIPEPLRGYTQYLLNSEENYAKLHAFLTGQAGVTPGEIGSLKALARNLVEPLRFDVSDMPARQLPLLNLPDRNPFFTGREDVLTQIQEALAERGRAALSGLGGVGKTQTAMEYAHRHLAEYANVFWTTADSQKSLVSGYVTIAGLLKLPEAKDKDQTLAEEAVKRWLSSHEGWLLILDNADDLRMARAFLPSGKKGHVILTTQSQAAGAIARRVEIQEMGKEEGALFLLRWAKYLAENALFETAIPADQAEAKAIAAQLDGFPLALDQAGAYIEETSCGLSGYLDLYRNHGPELLRRRGVMASDHPDPVATTWELSFENIEKANPAAAELLRFCAFLHPDGIPEEVFSKGAPELGPVLGPVGSDAFALNSAISEILKYSLLRRDPNARILEIHRLVQAVLKQGMDQAAQRLWAERAVRAVNRAFPKVEFSTRAVCERLLAQAHACAELINQWGFGFPEAARLLNKAGSYLHERGRYTEAEPLYQRALAIREKALGPEHPDVATSLNNLALLSHNQGQYAKAESLYQRALAIREKALGPEHPDVATSLDNLAVLYHVQGQSKKAEPSFERALAIREKALGPDHTDVASSLHNLARSHRVQGRYAEAEPLYRRALAIAEKALGPEHPDVAPHLDSLAALYRDKCQYADAESLLERALTILEKALGPNDRRVAWTLHSMASLYRDERQYDKAEPLYERALAIWEKALGPEHPDVGQTLHGMARLYDAQGQYAKAESFYERALAIWEKAFGPVHPKVAKALGNYASLLRNMGRSEEAAPLEARAREIRARSA
jgi:tetratricopeptide (TPR) repeat protein